MFAFISVDTRCDLLSSKCATIFNMDCLGSMVIVHMTQSQVISIARNQCALPKLHISYLPASSFFVSTTFSFELKTKKSSTYTSMKSSFPWTYKHGSYAD